jgi:hypothetical protein
MFGFGSGSSNLTKVLSVAHVQVVALYYPKTGTIRHLHMVTTMSGARPLTQEEAIAEAKQRASLRHGNVEELAIALSNDAEHGHRPHRIDIKTKAFVPLPNARNKPTRGKKAKTVRKRGTEIKKRR